jgi:hypothetical protein
LRRPTMSLTPGFTLRALLQSVWVRNRVRRPSNPFVSRMVWLLLGAKNPA